MLSLLMEVVSDGSLTVAGLLGIGGHVRLASACAAMSGISRLFVFYTILRREMRERGV